MSIAKADISRGNSVGNFRSSTLQVTLDNSYPTGGYALAATDFGLTDFAGWVNISVLTPDADAQYYTWDRTNKKIKLWVTAGTEVANAVDVSAAVLQVTAYGNG